MPRVIRRGLTIGVLVGLLAALAAANAGAVAPEGPRLATVKWSFRPNALELLTVDQAGKATKTLRLAEEGARPLPAPDPPSWSPDGTVLVFTGIVGERREKFSSGPRTELFVVAADGSGLRALPGTEEGTAPIFSPNGHTIAFAKERRRLRANNHGGGNLVYDGSTTWLVDVDGGPARRITPWRNHLKNIPSSFSPDGASLALTREKGHGTFEAITLRLDTGVVSVLADEGLEPVYSPDGAEIALFRGRRRTLESREGRTEATLTDLFTVRPDGSDLRRLTNTPKAIEFSPSWDPSGQRIAFIRLDDLTSEASTFGFGDAIMEINRDGSCPTKVLSRPRLAYFGAVWQPGPGREAGPIAC